MICSLLLCGKLAAQDTLRHYRTVALSRAVALSADNTGNVYVADKEGNIHSYDSAGNYRLTYSPPETAEVTLLDARSAVRIFAFYRELQSFALLNRFLVPIEVYRFQLPDGGFVRMAAQAADNNFWIYDDITFSLKKFDKKFGRMLLQTDLNLLLPNASLDITQMAEYRNYLFLLAKGYGILQFDNIGNFIRRLPTASPCFALGDDAIFYFENGHIVKQALYTNLQTRFVLALPSVHVTDLTVTGDTIITLEENQLRFWRP